MFNISCVSGGSWFEQETLHFLVCHRPMLHSMRDDQEFSGPEIHNLVAEFNSQHAVDGQKELVFTVVPMPDEFATELHQLYLLAVKFSNHFGAPVLGDGLKFFINIDFFHTRNLGKRRPRNNLWAQAGS
jgi:hypothetical protein